jgi:hypothetical protein
LLTLPGPLPCLRATCCCGTYVACLLSSCGTTPESVYREGWYDKKSAAADQSVAQAYAYGKVHCGASARLVACSELNVFLWQGQAGIREAVFYSAMRASLANIDSTVQKIGMHPVSCTLLASSLESVIPGVHISGRPSFMSCLVLCQRPVFVMWGDNDTSVPVKPSLAKYISLMRLHDSQARTLCLAALGVREAGGAFLLADRCVST